MENGIFFLGGKEKDLGLLLPGFVFQTPRIKKWQSFLKFFTLNSSQSTSKGSTLQAEGEELWSFLGTLQWCPKMLQEGGSVLGEQHSHWRLTPISLQMLMSFERNPSGSPCLSFHLQRCPKDNWANEPFKVNMDKEQLRSESEASPTAQSVGVIAEHTHISKLEKGKKQVSFFLEHHLWVFLDFLLQC